MPEGQFLGHEGFRDWYRIAFETFKPNCQHLVEQIEVIPNGDKFDVKLRVRLLADTYPDSTFVGQSVNILVDETWQVSFDTQGDVLIHNYLVAPVVS